MKSEEKKCANCGLGFTITPDDFAFYEKIGVPAPTWCPLCRIARKMSRRNERFFKTLFQTNYTKEEAPHILCEKCYKEEVI